MKKEKKDYFLRDNVLQIFRPFATYCMLPVIMNFDEIIICKPLCKKKQNIIKAWVKNLK